MIECCCPEVLGLGFDQTQTERNQNILLREDNARLKSENDVLKIRLTNPTCGKCNGTVLPDAAIQLSFEGQQLIRENTWLKDELAHLRALAEKVMANPLKSSHPSSNGYVKTRNEALETGDRMVSTGLSLGHGTSMSPSVKVSQKWPYEKAGYMGAAVVSQKWPYEKAGYMGAAVSAMNELMKLAESHGPIWTPIFNGSTELLNRDEYVKMFPASTCSEIKPGSSFREGSRDATIVTLRSQAIIEILMDADKWLEAFPCLIANASATDVVYDCPIERKDGYLQLVTWIEHLEYDTSSIHPLFRHAINSSMLFSAPRWVASLQRHCHTSNANLSGINPGGRQNILKLAQHMNELFCSGVCPALRSKWENIRVGNISDDVKRSPAFGIFDYSCPGGKGEGCKPGGSLVTLGFQILVSGSPSAKLTLESFETVSNLVSFTIDKIKAAMGLTYARRVLLQFVWGVKNKIDYRI
ncbi:hypothetical protein MLD38_040744 [Melastoma candidum]|nr:hypothetical protein MLD38_040744 [Melastoma candidum]